MRHFVAYHSAGKMGHDYEPSGDYSFLSRKALGYLEQTVGEIVWVVNGSRLGAKTNYSLRGVYIPDEVIDAEDEEFDYLAVGNIGYDFDPPFELSHLPWFPGFLKSQSNFSLGINEIRDSVIVQELLALTSDFDLSSLSAAYEFDLPTDLDVLETGVTEEGLAKYVVHLRRERNQSIVEAKKAQALTKHGRLQCEVCGFDFEAFYGELGEGFCEVHHTVPLASIEGKRVTTLAELAIVCSNCHRILHRNHPMLSISELRARLKS